jgi:hypothetical protein
MEFHDLQQRLNEIANKLQEARKTADACSELLDKLILDLLRENATSKDREPH